MPEIYRKQWQFLKKTAEMGKEPHALLFYGSDSPDRKTMALELIKLLNCQNGDFNKRPCQACRSCQDIDKKIHPDLFIIDSQESKEIKISQIRDLHSRLSLRSYSAPFKAVIIDKAHCLNQESQSAFLKLLEEPKGKTIFILLTEYPEMLLPTILSRVEKLRFYSPLKPLNKIQQKKIIDQILDIRKQDVAGRFQYAQKMSQDPDNLKETFDVWLRYFRELFILTVNRNSQGYSLNNLQKILRTIETTNFLISTTNVNSRLALEILMLEL